MTDRIKEKAKSSIIVQIAANVLLRAITSSFQALIISNNNTFFLRLSNTLRETITSMPQNLDAEIS